MNIFTATLTRAALVLGTLPLLWSLSCHEQRVTTEDGGPEGDRDSETAVEEETLCDDLLDNDDDGLVDCLDMDCAEHLACAPPSDADADVDSDADSDDDGGGDVDGDADGDLDESGDGDVDVEREETIPIRQCEAPVVHSVACATDCSDSELFDNCEVGDCMSEGGLFDCCVADDITCCADMSLGEMYSDLEVNYRGFYDNQHLCNVRLLESAGRRVMMFVAQTRGDACEYGFIRVQLRAVPSEITTGEVYQLCDDERVPNMVLVVTVSEGGTDQTTFMNFECEIPGRFVLTRLGTETGDGYHFLFEGRVNELDEWGRPTGTTLDITVDSAGLIEFIPE